VEHALPASPQAEYLKEVEARAKEVFRELAKSSA